MKKLPKALNEINLEIEESKKFLLLENNWDGEGAMAANLDIYNSAIKFLNKYSLYFYKKNIIIKSPEINLCCDGTIDLLWQCHLLNSRLLINFKYKEDKIYLSYYGYSYNLTNIINIKGSNTLDKICNDLIYFMEEFFNKKL